MVGPQRELEGVPAIDPTDLLRHARAIAGNLPDRTETDYRRAVSAAYYALFHAVTLQAARVEVESKSNRPERWDTLTRRFRHKDVRLVATWVAGGTLAERYASRFAGLEFGKQVESIATAFLDLIREREEADYDHSSVFTQERAVEAIDTANEAVETILSLSPPDGPWLVFLERLGEVARSPTGARLGN